MNEKKNPAASYPGISEFADARIDCEKYDIATINGVKIITFRLYFYYADELEPGNGRPWRRVDFSGASMPLKEFIENYKTDKQAADLLEQEARQYILELSDAELEQGMKEEYEGVPVMPYEFLTEETPDGTYFY